MLEIQCRNLLAGDRGIARDEFSCFRATVINNREYGVESLRFWEVCDQVHGHHLEGSRMGVGRDRLEGGFPMCGSWFILLTGCTSSYVVFRKVLHVFPLVSLAEEVYGVRYAWVTCEGVVVIRL